MGISLTQRIKAYYKSPFLLLAVVILGIMLCLYVFYVWVTIQDISPETGPRQIKDTPANGSATIHEIPSEIYPEQIQDTYTYGGIDYLIYQRTSLNIPIQPSTESAGILYATKKDVDWNYFVRIKELADSKNNPYFLDFDLENIYLLIVDSSGAGSGEGIAKLLQRDQDKKEWSTMLCFYYSPDHFKWEEEQGTLEETSNTYVANFPDYHYKLNPETGNYESYYFNSEIQTTEIVTTENCNDFEIIDLVAD